MVEWVYPFYGKQKAPEFNRGLENIIIVEGYAAPQQPQVAKYTTTANTTTPITIIHFLSIIILL